jgi:uncharacterized lipoprotein NlpE involved in copper resistance
MKKGLFSILAGALLVVGCQNYDDQFSNIESQITALASQVAGLSQVQSDLTTLAGTVNALQANIGDTVDAALADGLADIDTAVASLEAATESAASSEDVAAIADAVADQQEDLATILSASQFFQGDVTVNTVADLTTYHDARAAFKVINGNVTINSTSDMDMVKVQELVDAITQASLDYTYTAGTGVTTEITFNKLTSTRSLTLNQKGGYVLQNLTAATNISLDDDSTVDVVDLRALTTVTSLLSTGDATGDFKFKKALELHLTALPYYTPGTLSLQVDEGSVIDITALRDVTSLGVAAALALTLDGPATVAITTLSGDKASSSLTLKNVANATLTGYDGAVTIGDDVKNFTSNGLVDWTVTGTDLVSIDVTGILNPNAATADTKGPAVALTSQGDLTSVKLAGTILSVDLTTNGNLTEVIISETVQDEIDLDGNSDLTTVTLTGSTMAGVTINNNSDLEALTIDTTFAKGTATAAKLDGKVIVTDNESLETLTVSSDKVETLTVTGNDDLVTVNFTGLATYGASAKPVVNIYDNDLEATKFTDTIDVTASANGGATDIGTIDGGVSGMSSLYTYLEAVRADTDSTANVYFDTVSSFISEAAAETTDKLFISPLSSTQNDENKVLVKSYVASTAPAADDATFGKRTFKLNATAQAAAISLVANGIDLLVAGIATSQNLAASVSQTLGTNFALASGNLLDVGTLAMADVAGVSLALTDGADAVVYVGFGANTSAAQNSVTTAVGVAPQLAINASDTVTIGIDGLSATVTGTAYDGSAANLVLLFNALGDQWSDNYVGVGASVKSEALVKWTLSSVSDAFSAQLTSPTMSFVFTAKDVGSSGIGKVPTVTITSGKTATATNLGYIIGHADSKSISTSDDGAFGTSFLLTVTADTAGSVLGEIGSPLNASSLAVKGLSLGKAQVAGANVTELISDYAPNSSTASNGVTATNGYVTQSRADVIVPEEGNAAGADNSVTVNFSRVSWLT